MNGNEKYKELKKTQTLTMTTSIMFLIILILTIFTFIDYYINDSGTVVLGIAGLIVLIPIPLIATVVLAFVASYYISKCESNGINIPKKIRVLGVINNFQIPIIILVFIIGFNLKDAKYNNYINRKLDEIYNSKYKIINRNSNSNEGGDNYEVVMIELEDFDYPVICKFDWANKTYDDNYEELIQANKINYHEYINSIFNDEIVSLMYVSNDRYYSTLKLNLLLPEEYLSDKNKSILKDYATQITNEYIEKFPDYDFFSFNIYFSKNVDKTLIKDYYIYFCDIPGRDKGTDQIESSITKMIYIHIAKRDYTNINNEINYSFNNIKNII